MAFGVKTLALMLSEISNVLPLFYLVLPSSSLSILSCQSYVFLAFQVATLTTCLTPVSFVLS